jgi:hypothetical protein
MISLAAQHDIRIGTRGTKRRGSARHERHREQDGRDDRVDGGVTGRLLKEKRSHPAARTKCDGAAQRNTDEAESYRLSDDESEHIR